MTSFTIADYVYMSRALRLARRGLNTAHPNPRVGCVLARDGAVVGEGWHAVTGEAHAEVNALAAAGSRARGATAYVTLEPCAHSGRTGPCTEALIRAGVARTVAAMADPFSEVGGRGIAALADAGIETALGLLESAARDLNPGYLSRIERGRPFVRVKIAASADGATAMTDGESRWITGAAARRDVQRLRARSDAILTGVGTVLADDPALTVREAGLVLRQPLRVVVDSRLRMPAAARLLSQDGETLVACVDDAARGPLARAGAQVLCLDDDDGRVRLDSLLAALAAYPVNEVLVEAGPQLTGALLQDGLVDELVIYQAPHIMGSETRRLAATPGWLRLGDRLQLEVTDRRQVGADTRITAVPAEARPAGS